jgi:hypothetical protein
VAVAGYFAWRDLLHGAVDGVEEGLGFVGAGHGLVDWAEGWGGGGDGYDEGWGGLMKLRNSLFYLSGSSVLGGISMGSEILN